MPGVLTVREDGAERRVTFETRAVVGRDADCDVVLRSRSVSRRHALVEKAGAGWVARDLGSANGVFVEGKRVSEAPLASGASLRFGDVPATFEVPTTARTSSAENGRDAGTATRKRRSRPVAIGVTVVLAILALVAATLWSKYCDHAPRAGTASAAPAPVSRG